MRCPNCGSYEIKLLNRNWDNMHPNCNSKNLINCCRETWKCFECITTWTQWACKGYKK